MALAIYKVIQQISSATGITNGQVDSGAPIGTSITLGGSFTSNGVATLPVLGDKAAQQITIFTTEDESATSLELTGFDASGLPTSETIVLSATAGDDSVITSAFFSILTSAVVKDDPLNSTVSIQWFYTGSAITQTLTTNFRQGPGNVTFAIEPSPDATLDPTEAPASLQYSTDNPLTVPPTFASFDNDAAWVSPTTLVSETSSADTVIDGPIMAARGIIEGVSVEPQNDVRWRFKVLQGDTDY